MLRNITLLFFLLVFMNSCVEPYNAQVNGYEDLLVVDGLITDENKSHQVKLTRSIANLDEIPVAETNAVVVISCNDGTSEVLKEFEPGVYKTDSVNFVVKIGNRYKLSIRTSQGKNYHSEECEILTPTAIEKIYYNKKDIIGVNNEDLEGISFFVDGSAPVDSYLRWMYDEDWKFSIPYPTLIGFDENKELVEKKIENEYCWKKSNSYEIITQSLQSQNSSEVKGKEVCFIPSDNTDRFNIKYAINIKQLRISEKEYLFWNKLKESSEEVGDIFGTQPFTIEGNITIDDDTNELVLGYFQTGSVASKRIFIDYEDIVTLNLQLINNSSFCSIDTVEVDNDKFYSLYGIYEEYVLNKGLRVYDRIDAMIGEPDGLLIVSPFCNDCSLTGSTKKPLFWED